MINKESIKELLLEGFHLTFPYKEEKFDHVGDALLYIFSGYYDKPKIVFRSNYHSIEFELKDIDTAIQFYINTVLNEKNLWYKMDEVQQELNQKEEYFDMERDDDYEKIMNLRKEKIENGRR
jgi:hypothetical protein